MKKPPSTVTTAKGLIGINNSKEMPRHLPGLFLKEGLFDKLHMSPAGLGVVVRLEAIIAVRRTDAASRAQISFAISLKKEAFARTILMGNTDNLKVAYFHRNIGTSWIARRCCVTNDDREVDFDR